MTPVEWVAVTVILVVIGVQFVAAIALNEGQKRDHRNAREASRAQARAAAQEYLARRNARPWVDIDVERRKA